MDAACQQAIDWKVAFVPGKYFFAEKGLGLETMRLNYSMVDEETLRRAVKSLGEVMDICRLHD